MSIQDTVAPPIPHAPAAEPVPLRLRLRALRRRLRRAALRLSALLLALVVLGSGALPYRALVQARITQATAGHGFDLLGWEAQALAAKARALVNPPAAGLTDEEGAALVRAYLRRARDIRELEGELARLRSEESDAAAPLTAERISATLLTLRAEQEDARPAAEAVIERQIGWALREAGFGWRGRPMPPVLFSFTESPRKLVLSPRARIITAESAMLDPAMPLASIEQAEQRLEAGGDYSAYIAQTGGLGAFPTMVIDDASLPWILNTVAHEWVHTYLAFFPLGFTYGESADNIIINETAADIVGDAIGRRALARFYPELVRPLLRETPPELIGAPAAERPFDFCREMAETRRVADLMLRFGRVADAEKYMELRRLLFAENGYHIRRLNQAYFAFHGSYGTGPAADISTPDAVAPKVEALYARTGDVRAFLHAIRGIRNAAGLDRLLAD